MREILLNGYIDDEVWFGDEITPDALHDLLYAERKDTSEDVHIRLNSYGGSCNAAVRMHDDLAAYPGKVSITISGTAASAATVLCMAADSLDMTPGSLYMIHDPSIVAMGNVHDLKDAIRLLEASKESILNVYETRMKITREQASAMMSKTTWMDAQEALEDGFIDSILSVRQAGATDSIVPVTDAQRMVQAWFDRHDPRQAVPRATIQVKEGILRETTRITEMPEAKLKTEETQIVPCPEAEPPAEPSPKSKTQTGTPASQLQKRLALIMPSEAKNKGE
ncbi:MAG: Clp protease ClpP [Lachnospiraceae bacterium]|nr:Clp protease ClpP [Lachnospiraceae bacterium]